MEPSRQEPDVHQAEGPAGRATEWSYQPGAYPAYCLQEVERSGARRRKTTALLEVARFIRNPHTPRDKRDQYLRLFGLPRLDPRSPYLTATEGKQLLAELIGGMPHRLWHEVLFAREREHLVTDIGQFIETFPWTGVVRHLGRWQIVVVIASLAPPARARAESLYLKRQQELLARLHNPHTPERTRQLIAQQTSDRESALLREIGTIAIEQLDLHHLLRQELTLHLAHSPQSSLQSDSGAVAEGQAGEPRTERQALRIPQRG